MMILWIKALHIFFMVAWMAGIFYLPRLFVYHSQTKERAVIEQFKTMERRLWFFVTPFSLLTLVFGVWLMTLYGKEWLATARWLHYKLLLVIALYIYHFYLFVLLKKFAKDLNQHSTRFYRILNETPVLVLLAIVFLAVAKPF